MDSDNVCCIRSIQAGIIMKIALVNDTFLGKATTGGGHFGCELVMDTFDEHLDRCGHTIVQRVGSHEHSFKISPEADLVIVNGEGSLHHDRRKELIAVAKEAPSILVNTVWQDNSSTDGLEHFKFISVRESLSAEQLGECEVIPDMLYGNSWLWSRLPTFHHKPEYMSTLITDSVTKQGQYSFYSAINSAVDVINTLLKHYNVCTGRYHIAVACSILGIPFSCYPSNTHKIEGMLKDAGCSRLMFKSYLLALEGCPTEFDNNLFFYAKTARSKVESLFDRLESFA